MNTPLHKIRNLCAFLALMGIMGAILAGYAAATGALSLAPFWALFVIGAGYATAAGILSVYLDR